jgi:hypothetical protein
VRHLRKRGISVTILRKTFDKALTADATGNIL